MTGPGPREALAKAFRETANANTPKPHEAFRMSGSTKQRTKRSRAPVRQYFPPLTSNLKRLMKAKGIEFTPDNILKGVNAHGGNIKRWTAIRHFKGETAGEIPYQTRRAYALWLGMPEDFDITAPVKSHGLAVLKDPDPTDDDPAGAVLDEVFEAAVVAPEEAHSDLSFLLTSTNGGLAKYALRKLRQLTDS